MLDVCLLGHGGVMPLPERPLSTLLVRFGSDILLFDCGEGTQVNWRASGWSMHDCSTIILTHLHADHVLGLPGLLYALANAGRTDAVTILAPQGSAERLQAFLSIVGRLPFELFLRECAPGEQLPLAADLTLTTCAAVHQMPCLAYRLDITRHPRFDADRARALHVPLEAWSFLQRGEPAAGFTPDQVRGPARRGLRLTFITDSSTTPELAAFAHDSDLLVCEAMYASDDDAHKARQRGHMTARQAAALARDAAARQLWLTHVSPSVEDPEDVARMARAIYPAAIAGTPGLRTLLHFSEEDAQRPHPPTPS